MKQLLIFALGLFVSVPALAGQPIVELTKKGKTVEVTVDGKPFTVYNFDKSLPKPFFSPARAANGSIITREIKDPEDHPHHKGIWLSVDEINDVRFWAEKGKIENASVKILNKRGDPARFRVVNDWLGEDKKPIITEQTTISIFSDRLIAYDIRFEAKRKTVTFGDTKEGLFGIRLANTIREREGGKVENADGLKTSPACWGKVSDWVDYYGPVDGKIQGVAIFDHPLNFRRSRYHVRNYGLFSISPFGEKAYTSGKRPADPVILLKGSSLRLRYGLYIHAGDTKTGGVAQRYRRYLKAAGDG